MAIKSRILEAIRILSLSISGFRKKSPGLKRISRLLAHSARQVPEDLIIERSEKNNLYQNHHNNNYYYSLPKKTNNNSANLILFSVNS